VKDKRCSKCGRNLPLDSYHRDRQKKDGRQSFCKDCKKDYRKKYNAGPEVKERMKEYYARPEVKERKKEYRKEYWSRPEVKERGRLSDHKKSAMKRSLPHDLTVDEWQDTLSRFDGKCVYCGDEWEHQDHLWPFSKAGGYTRNNIVPSCAPCNLSKTDKYPADFIPKVALFEILHTLGVH